MTDLKFEANLPKPYKSSPTSKAARYGLLGTTALCAASLAAAPARAEPTGGTVVGGDGSITQAGAITTVDQNSQKLSLTWTSLDVGEAETLIFNQPNVDAIALNRVLSDLPTEVLGNLTANGNVWIINPNGVAFGPNSVVDVGGLLATTTDIPEADFWDDTFSFSALTGSSVEYSKVTADGTILAGKGGVVLVAPVVEASGLITTVGGDVAIATARAFRVDFDGDGLLTFTVESGAEGVLQLAESSVISAQGGAVYLSAGAADAITESVVNVGGLIESSQVEQRGGEIILSAGLGGEVIVTAELSAPGGEGQTGGAIDVFGDSVTIASGAVLDVSGEAGGGDIRIGGDYQGGGDAPTASATWVTADAMLNADATVDGDGGTVIVWSDHWTKFEGSLSAVGAGSGGGGFAEISGKESLSFAGYVDLSAESGDFGTLLFDPGTINIVAGAGTDDDEVTGDGQVDAGDGGNSTFEIGATTLDDVNADIILQASGDININADLTLAQNGADTDLTLNAGGDIVVSQTVTISADGFIDFNATGSIVLNASVTISNSDGNSNPNIDFSAGDQILLLADVSVTADGDLTLVAGGDADDNAAIVFGADSSLTADNGLISISSSGGADPDNNSILFGGGFSLSADTTVSVTSSDQIVFGATLDSSGTQVYSDGSIGFESGSGATFSAGLDLIFMSDPGSTVTATVVGVTGSVLFTVTGTGDGNDIIFQDDAAFTVSAGEASFDTSGLGDIEIQQDASIEGASTGSLNFVSDDQVQIGASVTIATDDDDITIQGGQAFVAVDDLTLDAGDDLIFDPGSTVTFNATGAITLMAGDDIVIDNSITFASAASVLFDAGSDFSFDHTGANTIASSAGLTIETGADVNIGDDEELDGASSVELDAGDDVNILQDARLSASTTLVVEAADDVTLGNTGGGDDDITFSAGGGTTIRAGDTLTLDANGGDNTDIHVTGSLTIEVAEIVFDSDSTIDAGTATVTFSSVSDGAITIDGGATGLNVSATDLDKITAGEIAFETGGAITVDTLTFNDADKLTLTAGDAVTFEGDSTIDADLVVSATGVVTINSDDTLGVTGTASIASSDLVFGNSASSIAVSGGSSPTLTLVNIDTDLMTLGAAETAGDTDDWDITSDQFAQLDAAVVEFQTAGDVEFSGFTQATSTADIELSASGSVTFLATTTNEFNEDATIIAGDGEGTGSVVFETGQTLQQPAGALTFYGENITQEGGAINSSGTIAFYAVDASGTFTGDVTLAAGVNAFANYVNAKGDTVELHASSTLPIGLVEANNAIFNTSSTATNPYVVGGDTTTTYVDVGTGTATLFFGTATVTVTDAGGTPNDDLDLTNVDDDDFGFINPEAAVGVGTEGDITVTGADWSRGISLISTGGTITFSGASSSFAGLVSLVANGDISQESGSGTLTTTGGAAFESTSGSITLDNASNSFGGAISASTFDATSSITIVNTSTGAITLGEIATPGDFTLTASGDVTSADDATFEIGGSTTVTIDGATNTLVALVSHGTETTSFGGLVTIDVSNSATIDTVELGGNGAITADVTTGFAGTTATVGLSTFSTDASGAVDVTIDTNVELVDVGLSGSLTLGASGSISQDSSGSLAIEGTATFTADATGTIVLANSGNDFNDVVIVQAASADLADVDSIDVALQTTGTLALAAEDAVVASTGSITFGDVSVTNTLQVTSGGSIDDGPTGTSVIAGSLDADATGSVTLDNPTNDFGSIDIVAASANVFDSDNGVDLAGVSTTGDFVLTTSDDADDGNVTQSGPLLIGGTTTITADGGSGNITLGDFSNVFTGPVILTGDVVYIATTATLTLGAIDATDFSFSAPNFIFDDTTFDGVSGTVTFVAQPGRAFLIGEDDYIKTGTETFGIDAGSTTFVSNAQIDILEAEATVTGVGFETDDNIYVDGLVTNLDVFLTASGTVQFVDGATGTIATTSIFGDLTVNAGGAISQFFGVDNPDTTQLVFNPITLLFDEVPLLDNLTANLFVTGDATFNSSSTVTLTNSGNNFSTSSVSGSATNFSITDVNAIGLDDITTSGNLTVIAGSTINVNGTLDVGGALSLTANNSGGITDNGTGVVLVDLTTSLTSAGAAITLDDATNDFGGAVTATGLSLAIADANGISFGNVTLGDTAATNFFTVTANADGASTGSVTITGALDSGNATISAGGGNVTATNVSNDIDGTLTVTANNLSVTNSGSLTFGATNLTGNLVATAGGTVSDAGNLNVSGTTTVTAAGQAVALNNSGTDFGGAVTVTAGTIWLNDVDDITLGQLTQTTVGTGTDSWIFITAGGPVTGSQAIDAAGYLYISSAGASGSINLTGAVDVGEVGFERDATFIATNDITVNNAANDFDGDVAVDGENVTLRDANSISFGQAVGRTVSTVDGDLSVTAGGAVSEDSDTSLTVSGTTTVDAGSSVTLASASNDFKSAVAVDANGAVSLTDQNTILLGDIDSNGGVLTVVASATGGATAISQSGTTTLDVGGASFTATTAGDVILTNDNDFNGTVVIVSANDVAITDVDDLTIGSIALSDVGTDTGALSIDVVDADITVGASGLIFDSSTVTNTLDVATTGNINQIGAITGGSSLTITVNAANVDIDLLHNGDGGDSDLANDFSYFALAGLFPANSLELRDASGDIDFGDLAVLGDFSLEVVGSIASGEDFDINGSTFIEVTGTGSDVRLTSANNTFGDSADDTLTIIADDDIELAALSVTGDVSLDGDGVSMSVTTVTGDVGVTATGDVDISGGTFSGLVDVDGDIATSTVTVDVGSIVGRVDATGYDVDIITNGGIQLGDLMVGNDLGVDANNSAVQGAVNADTVAIRQADGTTIDVGGDAAFDANGGDVELLEFSINGAVDDLLNFNFLDQPNAFDGDVTITSANDIHLGASSELTIAGAVSDQTYEAGEIVFLAPDMNLTGGVSAPVVYLANSTGSTKLGDGGGAGDFTLTDAELEFVDAANWLYVVAPENVIIGDLSLSGAAGGIGYNDSFGDLGLVVWADGNVTISGFVTSSSGAASALDLAVIGENIYVTGKLGVADFDAGAPGNQIGDPEMMPLGDLYLWAVNDLLIGTSEFVALTDATQLEGPNIEFDLTRTDEVLVHTVGAGADVSSVFFGGAGNIAMQTTNSGDSPDDGKGLELGNLYLYPGWNGGSPDFVNLFGAVVQGAPGTRQIGQFAAGSINVGAIGGGNANYEMNGCIIGGIECFAFGTILSTPPLDEGLFLDLALDPEEEEDDDPFTNRGNEEEWR